MKLIKMPSIEQFRNACYNISHTARYDGIDEDGNAKYNFNQLPILDAFGTVKIHGTNVSVCFNNIDGIYAQSKDNIITSNNDNAGFAFFVETNKSIFLNLMNTVIQQYNIDIDKNTITIYGEWAGKGIQKGVGISEIDKTLFIFGIKISPFDEDIPSYWLESDIFKLDKYNNIFHIKEFKTFKLMIDFNNPLLSNNKMVEMVQEVETECPVAKYFGVSGIGEGIVFEAKYKDNIHRWKMKGEKHAGKSKVKAANKVDDKKLQLIIDFVEKVTPEWRLEQMYQETFNTLNGGKGDVKKTGDFIRSVINDIMKEELLVISEANLIPKDINASISKKARLWFMKKLDEESGIIYEN